MTTAPVTIASHGGTRLAGNPWRTFPRTHSTKPADPLNKGVELRGVVVMESPQPHW